MEAAVFIGKFNYKLLKGDNRLLSVIPMYTAATMPLIHFRDNNYIYLFTKCTENDQDKILDLQAFCRIMGTTTVFIFESAPTYINPALMLSSVFYITKQSRRFLRKLSKNLNASAFATPNTIIRYDSANDTILSKEL